MSVQHTTHCGCSHTCASTYSININQFCWGTRRGRASIEARLNLLHAHSPVHPASTGGLPFRGTRVCSMCTRCFTYDIACRFVVESHKSRAHAQVLLEDTLGPRWRGAVRCLYQRARDVFAAQSVCIYINGGKWFAFNHGDVSGARAHTSCLVCKTSRVSRSGTFMRAKPSARAGCMDATYVDWQRVRERISRTAT